MLYQCEKLTHRIVSLQSKIKKAIKSRRPFYETLFVLILFALTLLGCSGGAEDFIPEPRPAFFVWAAPPEGEIAANGTITVTFTDLPSDLTVSAGTVTGKTATIAGPFTPGPLALTLTWVDGTQALTYNVTAPDTDPPTVTGSTVSDGDKDVDP